jgi:hypothetical protein
MHYITQPPPGNATSTPHFRNITLEGLVAVPGTGVGAGSYLYGLPESEIEGIVLRDSDLRGASPPVGPTCNYTAGVCEGTVLPACPPCLTPAGP